MSSISNGQIRKSLASQLDRLDGILDNLADRLNEAIATVVTQAVTAATQVAVTEVLTNPGLHQRLYEALPASPNLSPISQVGCSAWAWFKDAAKGIWSKVAAWAKKVWAKTVHAGDACRRAALVAATNVCGRARAITSRAWSRTLLALRVASRLRKAILFALAAGVTVGLGCYLCGPTVSSLVSGIASFAGWVATAGMRTLHGLLGAEELQIP